MLGNFIHLGFPNSYFIPIIVIIQHGSFDVPMKIQTSLKSPKKQPSLPMIGWREWVQFPNLKIKTIKAKIDTGARTSALHAYNIKIYKEKGHRMVRFDVHPIQRNIEKTIHCYAKIHAIKSVKNSGGHSQKRITILTPVKLGDYQYPIEVTLTNRDEMGFRLLLGRTAVRNFFCIHPGKSFLLGKS